MRVTTREFEQVTGRALPRCKKRSKYGAIPTEVDGIRFDSKREAAYFTELRLLKAHGEILYFLRQVPIQLPGKTKYIVDFQVFYPNGSVRYVDVKGKETQTFRLKKRQVEALYPIEIEVVK